MTLHEMDLLHPDIEQHEDDEMPAAPANVGDGFYVLYNARKIGCLTDA